MNVKYFAIACSVLILFFVIELIRREKMTFKFALAWLSASIGVMILAIYDNVLRWLADLANFVLISNFIFFLFLLAGTFLTLLLTIYANEQNRRSEILSQSVGILEYRLRAAESKLSAIENKQSPQA